MEEDEADLPSPIIQTWQVGLMPEELADYFYVKQHKQAHVFDLQVLFRRKACAETRSRSSINITAQAPPKNRHHHLYHQQGRINSAPSPALI